MCRKRYPLDYVSKILNIKDSFKIHTNGEITLSLTSNKFKSTHKLKSTEDIRVAVNQVYSSACYIVGQFTGMRPNVLADILLSSCLCSEHGDELIVGEEHKGRPENYNLFDNRWMVIPIVKDAIRAASIISAMKGTDYLFSSANTLEYGKPPIE